MDSTLLLKALKTPRAEIWQRLAIMEALGYEPSPEQAAFHFDIDPKTGVERRHKMVTGGEQAGKSFSAAMELMSKLFWGRLFWIVAPDYTQAENEFNYIEAWCDQLNIVHKRNKPQRGQWYLETITGQVIVTKSTVDVATIAGKAPDGVLFVEAAQAPYEAFLRCYGRTGPRMGWLCINGTFEKDTGGWFRNLWKAAQVKNEWDLKSFAIPTWSNFEMYPGGEMNPEIQRLKKAFYAEHGDDDHFNERFGGIASAPMGVVHREFDYTRNVKDIHREATISTWGERDVFRDDGVYLPEDTVDELWIDPGYQFGYAVLFVTVWAGYAFVYDEIYVTYRDSESVVKLALKHPRWEHIARIVMDISGNTHAGGNKSAAETWYDSTHLKPLTRAVGVQEGIDRTRASLRLNEETGLSQLIISPKCVKTCWEYAEGYKYKMDRWGKPMPDEKPIDANNHSAKAIVYGLVINFGLARHEQRNKARKADKVGRNVPTVAGWEMLYENVNHLGEHDPADYDEDDSGYDASYEEDL